MASRLERRYGSPGIIWAQEVPQLVQAYCASQKLRIVRQFDSYESLVFEVSDSVDQTLILKMVYPGSCEASFAAYAAFSGCGGVPILNADSKTGILLMPKIDEDTSALQHFYSGNDEWATRQAATSILQIHSAPMPKTTDCFRRTSAYLESFKIKGHVLPTDFVANAQSMLLQLIKSTRREVLLHADLHCGNLLLGCDGKTYVIDPKGLVGDPDYEVGSWMRNPTEIHDASDSAKLLGRRLDVFCEMLGGERERYRQWSFVQMALAAIWLYEDDARNLPGAVAFAERLLRA